MAIGSKRMWILFKSDKSSYEISRDLMIMYIDNKGTSYITKELGIEKQTIMHYISSHIAEVKENENELYETYKDMVMEVRTRAHNPEVTDEWIEFRKQYRKDYIGLAVLLMKHYCECGNLDKYVEMSGISFGKLKSSYVNPYKDAVMKSNPDIFEKYEKVKEINHKLSHGKLSAEDKKKRKEYLLKGVEKKGKMKSIKQVLKKMPKKIDYDTFLDAVINCNSNGLSTRDILNQAREQGITVLTKTERGYVKAN